jgi:glycosyltransferase involved in cell wall biosynthesis
VKHIHYVSPSVIPSRSANSVHVVMQCHAFAKMGYLVSLYAQRSIKDKQIFSSEITEKYGIDFKLLKLRTYYSGLNKAVVLRIALIAIKELLLKPISGVIFSRNLYASFILAVIFKRPLVFETHQLEYGFRKCVQYYTMKCTMVKTVVISKKLRKLLGNHLCLDSSKLIVLHDAAPNGIERLQSNLRRSSLVKLVSRAKGSWVAICGYFGQLYSGRGVEVIEKMAKKRLDVLFLVFGGSNDDVNFRKNKNQEQRNLFFGGHIDHPSCQAIMRSVDILLMPYQHEVSIGIRGHDTARWMSPMKMFEYMASGVPIISSDLPVLREVLSHENNSLLVPPDNCEAWVLALNRLIDDYDLAESIGRQAHVDYKTMYTWEKRAEALMGIYEPFEK